MIWGRYCREGLGNYARLGLALAWCAMGFVARAAEVTIPDANLEGALRITLNQPVGPIEDSSLASITTLSASGQSISDLSGLEFCTSLETLDLSLNQITDLTPLKGLLNLTSVNLKNNNLCSVSRLLENPGIGPGDLLELDNNPLANFTCSQIITALQSRGASVTTGLSCAFGGGAPCPVVVTIPDFNLDAAIRLNRGITGGPVFDTNMVAVTNLDASSKDISDLTGLEYCVNISQLNLFSNQISNLSPLTYLVELAVLNLFGNQIDDVSPLAALVNLEDLSLGSNRITDIAPLANLTSMRVLDLFNNDVSDISPLDAMSAIEELNLAGNQVSDVSALNDKTDLVILSLANNLLTDIAPLAGAVSLDELDLFNNEISDITAIASMFVLRSVNLGSNRVSDIDPLEDITAIETINISDNIIASLSALAGLPDLAVLNASANLLQDISPLGGVTTLDTLDLSGNRIRNLAPLTFLNNLQDLDLRDNEVSDLSPLANLPQINEIFLDNNQICSFAPLAANPSLNGDTDLVSVINNPLSSFACSLEAGSLAGRNVVVETGTACDEGGGPPCNGAAIYVSPGGIGFGSPENPFGSIQDALDAASTLVGEGFTVTVFLAPGNYGEVLEIPSGVRVVGSGMEASRIVPPAALLGDDDDPVVKGGDHSSIEDLGISLPAGGPAATLIAIDGVDFDVLRVEANGAGVPGTTGIRVTGESSSDSLVRDSVLRGLGAAIEIDDSAARFGFNVIRDISGPAAIRISGDDSTDPGLGDLLDLRRSGSNLFRNISGRFIASEADGELRALANYWDNGSTIGAIRTQVLGQVNVALPLFTKPVKGGSPAATLFATVIDDTTEEPINNAQVSLVPVLGNLPKSGTPGVYVAALLPEGRYTVRAQKSGYEDEVELIDIFSGNNQVTLRMGSEGGGAGAFIHSGDANVNARIELTELLRVIQLYNSASGFSCGGGEDGFQLGPSGGFGCPPHAADYEGVNPNWRISLSELLRVVQIYNVGAYFPCGNLSEDGFCPGGK